MNVNEYIASGILEEYVAGLLSESENKAVEANAAKYPAIGEEIGKIELALENLAFAQAKSPQKDVKSAILAQIEAELPVQQPAVKTVELPKRNWGWLAAAAVVGLVASMVANFTLYNRLDKATSQIVALRIENDKMTQETVTMQANFKEKERQVNTLAHQNTRRLVLSGTPNHVNSKLLIYWQPEEKTVFATINQLPPAPEGKQYQLWAIGSKGPVDAGLLTDTAKGLQAMKTIDDAAAFAITLENVGGSPTPTLSEMYAIGKF
ncbi:MAG: hypothetical protein RL757_1210 [Bacteroidota bacterium]|jgi:anti-sigma-K factor RskA